MKDEIFDIETDINIDRLAMLARFTLSAEERASLSEVLKKMADYTYPRILSEEKALPFSFVCAEELCREDEPQKISEEQRSIMLSGCPSLSEDYVTVPQVINGEEE